jgi:5'-3' exonuclease
MQRRAALADALLRIYKRLLPLWGDYLTCSGVIRFSS